MPITKNNRALRGAKAALAAVLVAAALPAAASADTGDCPALSTSPVFSTTGDLNNYFLAPGGDFENRDVWSVTGNYGYNYYDASALPWAGPQALRLDDGAQATSPAFCVDSTYPHLRLGAQAVYGLYGTLTIEAIPAGGSPVVLGTLRATDFRLAALSTEVPLASKLSLVSGQNVQTQIRLSASRGSWGVDAVAIDPRSGG
jgi:hypothetical protein